MTIFLSSAISVPGDKSRINEDGWLILENPIPPKWMIAAAIDGASTRIALPRIKRYLSRHMGKIEPAVWATSIIKNSLFEKFTQDPTCSTKEVLLYANHRLSLRFKSIKGISYIYGVLEQPDIQLLPIVLEKLPKDLAAEIEDAFSNTFTDNSWKELDSRYLRLLLPACVVTLIKLDTDSGFLTFSHVGDTALIQPTSHTELQILTADQMGKFDEMMLNIASQAINKPDSEIDGVIEAVKSFPPAREQNILNGIRHNYVNEKGKVVPSEGCGVINGLSQIEPYIQTGTSNLNPGEKIYIMSDGLTLPLYSQLCHSTQKSITNRIKGYRKALQEGDIPTLFQLSREIEEIDNEGNIFHRAKIHDDATCIMISRF